MNNIVLTGRLTKKPETKSFASGSNSTTFSLAVARDFAKEGQQQTDFINIEVWGKSADNCYKYLDKGSLVGVHGSLRIENYETKEGDKRTFTKVLASKVEFLSSKNSNNDKPEPDFQPVDDSDLPF